MHCLCATGCEFFYLSSDEIFSVTLGRKNSLQNPSPKVNYLESESAIHLSVYLPSTIVVAERLCFHRCLSVHREGGVHPCQTDMPPCQADTPQADTPLSGRHPMPGRHTPVRQTPPTGRHSPGRHPCGQTPLTGRHPSQADTPHRQTPPGQTPPARQTPPSGRHPHQADTPIRQTPPPPDSYCSGRYASYWNAFLFLVMRLIQDSLILCGHFLFVW